jgi:hypothetical protein
VKIAFAVFLFIHAAAHAVGFLSVSGLVAVEDTDGAPSILLTGFDQDHWVMRSVAVLWLVALGLFVTAGIGVLNGASWTVPMLVGAIALSAALCVLWYREVPFGIAANVAIAIALVVPAVSERVLP